MNTSIEHHNNESHGKEGIEEIAVTMGPQWRNWLTTTGILTWRTQWGHHSIRDGKVMQSTYLVCVVKVCGCWDLQWQKQERWLFLQCQQENLCQETARNCQLFYISSSITSFHQNGAIARSRHFCAGCTFPTKSYGRHFCAGQLAIRQFRTG